jgi:hypothetical protein
LPGYIVAAEGGSEIIKTPLDPKEPYLITASRNIVAIYFGAHLSLAMPS